MKKRPPERLNESIMQERIRGMRAACSFMPPALNMFCMTISLVPKPEGVRGRVPAVFPIDIANADNLKEMFSVPVPSPIR